MDPKNHWRKMRKKMPKVFTSIQGLDWWLGSMIIIPVLSINMLLLANMINVSTIFKINDLNRIDLITNTNPRDPASTNRKIKLWDITMCVSPCSCSRVGWFLRECPLTLEAWSKDFFSTSLQLNSLDPHGLEKYNEKETLEIYMKMY